MGKGKQIVEKVISALIVGAQLYLVADAVTEGELTESLIEAGSNLWAFASSRYREEREIQRATSHVLFEAITIVESANG